MCMTLEFGLFISIEAALVSTVSISIHLAVQIPSVIRKHTDLRNTYIQITVTWVLTVVVALARMLTLKYEQDPHNYFCLPFLTSKPQSLVSLSVHASLIVLNLLLCLVCVSCHFFLFSYTMKKRQDKELKATKQRDIRLQRFAARMALLILTTLLTWMPSLLLQLICLIRGDVGAEVMFWVILGSFSVNHVFDPILMLRSALL